MPNIVFGLLAVALGSWGLATWWWSVVELLRGIVPLALILLGFVALGAGVSSTWDNNSKQQQDEEDRVDEELIENVPNTKE
jgi:fatty acid desaturase